jgi:hypothetical protein
LGGWREFSSFVGFPLQIVHNLSGGVGNGQ